MRSIESESSGRLFHGMTVKELREALRMLPSNMLVVGRYEGIHVPLQAVECLHISPDFGECAVLDVDEFTHQRAVEAIRSDEPE
jgi:hypothetical protein